MSAGSDKFFETFVQKEDLMNCKCSHKKLKLNLLLVSDVNGDQVSVSDQLFSG